MTTAIILLTCLAIWGICKFVAHSSKPDRIMSKYLLRDFEKEREKPVEYTPDFTEWRQYITDLRNGKV